MCRLNKANYEQSAFVFNTEALPLPDACSKPDSGSLVCG